MNFPRILPFVTHHDTQKSHVLETVAKIKYVTLKKTNQMYENLYHKIARHFKLLAKINKSKLPTPSKYYFKWTDEIDTIFLQYQEGQQKKYVLKDLNKQIKFYFNFYTK